MFLCVSLNPAVDKRLRLGRLQVGSVNRASEASPAPGGKAAHVAMVLKTLGADPLWLGFAGGATGKQLVEGLRRLAIRAHEIPTSGCTRTNLEIVEDEGGVTEILEPGQHITAEELHRFKETFSILLSEANKQPTVIFSGSLPEGVSPNLYMTLIESAHEFDSLVFVDTSGEAFKLALAGKPEFVKPNRGEAESWSGQAISGPSSAKEVLGAMLKAGAGGGAITLGSAGLIWRSATGDTLLANAPKLSARSCVGSGDSTLAGFAFAAQQRLPPREVVRLAAACGAANCLAPGPGCASAEDIANLKGQIRVETLA
ncbi:MAG TPA: 1-phosphofructokinase family hexose kinase [Candidatus Acidoferrum sp.]|nr:1-phosphofructokinase family hexose kinase [Candidatus Acidoferrum sp.]